MSAEIDSYYEDAVADLTDEQLDGAFLRIKRAPLLQELIESIPVQHYERTHKLHMVLRALRERTLHPFRLLA